MGFTCFVTDKSNVENVDRAPPLMDSSFCSFLIKGITECCLKKFCFYLQLLLYCGCFRHIKNHWISRLCLPKPIPHDLLDKNEEKRKKEVGPLRVRHIKSNSIASITRKIWSMHNLIY